MVNPDSTTGATGEEAFPLSISPLITLSKSLPNVTESTAVSGEVITATGPAGDSYTFTTSGNVPPGLSIAQTSATTAQLQGTPSQFNILVHGHGHDHRRPMRYRDRTLPDDRQPRHHVQSGPDHQCRDRRGNQHVRLSQRSARGRRGRPAILADDHQYRAPTVCRRWRPTTSNGGALPAGLSIATTASTLTISGTPTAFTQETAPVHINITGEDKKNNTVNVIYILDVEPNNASPYVAIQAQQGSTLDDDLPTADAQPGLPDHNVRDPVGQVARTRSR